MASKEISPLNTTHLYYADTELLSNTAEVIGEYSVEINGSQLLAIVLDQTVMHPQGGTSWYIERERACAWRGREVGDHTNEIVSMPAATWAGTQN